MHGRLILLLAFALWASVAAAQTLKYDWERPIPSGAVVSTDGSRMAVGTTSSEGIFSVTLYDGRTGQRLDTVVIDYTTTPKEYRAGVTFVDSTLVALVLKDGDEFRLVKYNERLQMFDTLQAKLYHTVSFNEVSIYRELSVNRLEGEFPKGVVLLNFAIKRVHTYYGSVENTGATVWIDIHKDSSWLGEVGRVTSMKPSGDRSRMMATNYEHTQDGGGGKFEVRETNTVNLYDGEAKTQISKTSLPRTDETFGMATVMGRSQTIVSGCQVWLGLIRDSIELSWGRIENLDCESWISLSGNSKVVAVRKNVALKRFELVVSDIYTKQTEVVDYWTSAFQPRVMIASSITRAVYVATDSNKVRRYAFHPLHQPAYAERVDLNMKDTVKRFETVHIIGVANTRSRFRVDSIKSSGGTFKFSSNDHSISGTFFATTPGMHDVEMWCTSELDSNTPIYHKGNVYVKEFNGAACSFKTNFLLQNILVGQGKLVVSPGRSFATSYVCPLDSLIDHNRFEPDTADLLSSGVVFFADEQRAVLGRDCGILGSGTGCLDIIEVDVSTNRNTKIGKITYRNEGGWHGFPIQASGFYVQYAEVPGTDLRIVGVGPKFYDWGLDNAPYDVRKYEVPGKRLVRGDALICVFNSSYQEFKDFNLNVANSIDSYPGSNVLLTMQKEKIENGTKVIVAFETIDPLSGEFKTEHDSVGLNVADAIRTGDSTYMTTRGIYRLMSTGELISIASFVEKDGADIVRINNSLSALIRRNTDTVVTIYNHFTGEVLQRLGSTHGLPRTGAYSPEHRMLFVGSDSGVVTGYDITRAVSVADESTSTISRVAARYHNGVITVDVGQPIDEVSIFSITGEQVFNGTLQDRPLQTSVTAMSWMSGAYVVRVRSGQRWGTSKVAVVR